MSSSTGPLHTPRVVILSLNWCFAIIAGAVGLNALIKSNQDKTKLKRLAPPPTRVEIDTSDIFNAGVVATTASVLIGVLVFSFLSAMILPATRGLSTRTLRVQGTLLALCSLFLLGALIPYMVFFVNREAKVEAFAGRVQLPAAAIKAAAKAAGATGVYKDIDYLKLVAILPWFSLLFTVISTVVLFKAASAAPATSESRGSSSPVMSEKKEASHHENA